MKFRSTIGRPLAAVAAIGAVVAATVAVAPLAQAEPDPAAAIDAAATKTVTKAVDGKYLVQLAAAAAPTYRGDVSGLASTASEGRSFDASSAAVDAYVAHLDAQRADVLQAADVSSASVFYEYDFALAGFAADLTYDEAQRLAGTPGVRLVEPNQIQHLDTSNTPNFLGLSDEGGLWDQLGGQDGLGGAGEDIVIGSIDSGFSPSAGSFAPLDPAPETVVPEGWEGDCDPGNLDDRGGGGLTDPNDDQPETAEIGCQEVSDGVSIHNTKVIAARYFVEGFGEVASGDFLSPKDYDGHGSHTGSTAGGNGDVEVEINGNPLGEISGMAPRARIAAYKVCWDAPDGSGCATSDSVMAINQAIADGVDVINYSISGPLDSATLGVALPFFNAAAAGIYVSVSAGNAGPSSATVAHNYPWVNTTAASTQNRRYDVEVIGEGNNQWVGSGIGEAVPESPSVYAKNAAANDADPAEAALCFPGTLDPDVVEGQIVVCDRGAIARTAKSQVVSDAGGVGMVLANDQASGGSVNAERHEVPTAHVSFQVGVEIKEYVGLNQDNDVTLALGASEEVTGDAVTAPEMASFSSRGPGQVASGDILKPDITAPGVDILAAYAPSLPNSNEQYAFLSGTSMSSPHMAGIGALMKDLFEVDTSPMAIESALVTTAYNQNNQGEPIMALNPETGELVPATPFNYGGGHVDPNVAAQVAAVYDSDPLDWINFLCGSSGEFPPDDPTCTQEGVEPIDASDLNRPSIAIGDLAGTQTVTRTLTNITDTTLALSSTVEVDGIAAVVEPAELTIEPGASADFTVTFTRTDAAPLEEYSFGDLTWTDASGDSPDLESPIAIRPVAIGDAENLLVGEGSTGDVTDTIVSGVNGAINVELGGLEPATVDTEVLTNPNTTFPDPPVERDDVYETVFEVPQGAYLAHFALYEPDYVVGTDLDMFLYAEGQGGELELIALSATGVAGESLLLNDLEAGTYHVFVHLYSLAPGETAVEAILHSWAVTDDDVDTFTVEPEMFVGVIGAEQDVTYSWTDLAEPDDSDGDQPSENLNRYLGKADYVEAGADEALARTVVRVDVAAGGPTPTPTETPTPTVTPTETPTTTPPTPTDPPTTSPPPTEPPTSPPTDPPTSPPTDPPTSPPTDPPTTDPSPTITTTLPGTGGGSAGVFAGLGLGAVLVGALFVVMAARRLREEV